MQFTDKVFFITGATSGIGRATALAAAGKGARVVITGRNRQALDELSAEISADGAECLALQMDVTEFDRLAGTLDSAVAHFGRLDVLVQAAGVIAGGSIETTTPEAWQSMMAINVDAVFRLMQSAVPHLEKTKGSIVTVSSVTGTRAFPNLMAYCVSKAAVDQLTRCAALDLAEKGIRVNAVNPGVVRTNLHRRGGMDEESYGRFLEHSKTTHPLGRVGEPEEIANAILYLASDEAGWVTGVTFNIDGGRQLTCAR